MTASYPILVRNGILDHVKAMPFFGGFKFASTNALQIQPEAIPFCGVYLVQETMVPDGDANVGEVRFRTTARIGFSVIIQNNDPELAEAKLDEASQVLTGLFSDHTLYDNVAYKIQGFVGGQRQHVFGSVGKDNELPVAELRLELSCDLGVITYPPIIVDDFNTLHVKTQYPGGDTQEEIDSRQQIEAEYDIPQN